MAVVTLAPHVHRIPTMGDYINSFAFTEADGSVTLVDCGIKRAPAKIVKALAQMGKDPNDVQRIVLTQAHNDHAGGAAEMIKKTTATGISAHEADVDFLEAGMSPPFGNDSTSGRIFARVNKGGCAPVSVDHVIRDGDILPVAGGLRAIHTPGHTPGHISLLHEDSGVLITGDAIFNMRSKLAWPFAAFCTSSVLNAQSAAVFADLDYRIAAFTHGPEIRTNAREQVRGFLARAGKN